MFDELIENKNVCKGIQAKGMIDKTSPETEFRTQ